MELLVKCDAKHGFLDFFLSKYVYNDVHYVEIAVFNVPQPCKRFHCP